MWSSLFDVVLKYYWNFPEDNHTRYEYYSYILGYNINFEYLVNKLYSRDENEQISCNKQPIRSLDVVITEEIAKEKTLIGVGEMVYGLGSISITSYARILKMKLINSESDYIENEAA